MIEKVNDIITTLPNNMTQRTVANSRIFLTALENTVQNGTSEAVDGHVSSVEPSGADRSRNTCYYGNGLTFPPVDAPQDFLKAWDETLDSMGWEGGLFIHDVMMALQHRDYYGPPMSDIDMEQTVQKNIRSLGYKGIIRLTKQCQQHLLRDNIIGGNEPLYIDGIRNRIRASDELLDKLIKR